MKLPFVDKMSQMAIPKKKEQWNYILRYTEKGIGKKVLLNKLKKFMNGNGKKVHKREMEINKREMERKYFLNQLHPICISMGTPLCLADSDLIKIHIIFCKFFWAKICQQKVLCFALLYILVNFLNQLNYVQCPAWFNLIVLCWSKIKN